VLSYETSSLLPSSGESVPCRHHGYCVVEHHGTTEVARPGGRGLSRARPRTQDELLEWRGRSVTTIHVLQRQRFTLRMIAAAERDGLVEIDLEAGTVAVLSGGRRLPQEPSATPCR
jgi:hypothetical protein